MIGQFLRRRVPVHFGGMSDPFQPAELRHEVTASFLETLAKYRYPTVLSTRGALVSSAPYIAVLQRVRNVVVQFSICSTRDEVAKKFEPWANSPSELLRAMETLSKNGVFVTCRWQPYIPGMSETAEEFVSRIASAGGRHVALEHLKVPVERNHPLWFQLNHAAGLDFHAVYQRLNALHDGREYVLPPAVKLPVVMETAREVRARGMTFGAADNEFQYLSDTDCCCSGVDQFPGFENWFRHQIGYAIRKCRGKRITLASVSGEWTPEGSIDRFLNSRSRLSKRSKSSGSVTEHVRARWNNPAAPGNPLSFYGIVRTPEVTSAGNKVYAWNRDLVKLVDI